jgi:competence protein ComER
MGSVLIEAMLKAQAVQPADVIAVNRTRSKAEQLARRHSGLRVADGIAEVAQASDVIFICVKPLEFRHVLPELKRAVAPEQIAVSITSPVRIALLEEQLPCKVAKVIPSITNYALSGAVLCMYGSRMTEDDRSRLTGLLNRIGAAVVIDEAHTRAASDLSSCGPAFLAFFLRQFARTAAELTGIPEETAARLAAEMALGTGRLLTSGAFTPEALEQRVAVPGGITAEGLRILAEETDVVFHRLIRATHAKYAEDLEKIEAAFYGTRVD